MAPALAEPRHRGLVGRGQKLPQGYLVFGDIGCSADAYSADKPMSCVFGAACFADEAWCVWGLAT